MQRYCQELWFNCAFQSFPIEFKMKERREKIKRMRGLTFKKKKKGIFFMLIWLDVMFLPMSLKKSLNYFFFFFSAKIIQPVVEPTSVSKFENTFINNLHYVPICLFSIDLFIKYICLSTLKSL